MAQNTTTFAATTPPFLNRFRKKQLPLACIELDIPASPNMPLLAFRHIWVYEPPPREEGQFWHFASSLFIVYRPAEASANNIRARQSIQTLFRCQSPVPFAFLPRSEIYTPDFAVKTLCKTMRSQGFDSYKTREVESTWSLAEHRFAHGSFEQVFEALAFTETSSAHDYMEKVVPKRELLDYYRSFGFDVDTALASVFGELC